MDEPSRSSPDTHCDDQQPATEHTPLIINIPSYHTLARTNGDRITSPTLNNTSFTTPSRGARTLVYRKCNKIYNNYFENENTYTLLPFSFLRQSLVFDHALQSLLKILTPTAHEKQIIV